MTPYYQRGSIALYLGDFREVMAAMAPGTVGAVIADPPYPRQYADLWEPLGQLSAQVLQPGGSLLSILPQYLMPDIYAQIGRHLKYRWTSSMWQAAGAHARMAMGVEVMWKPIGWWVKGSWPRGRGFVRDGFLSYPLKKSERQHIWQQPEEWADYCLGVVHARTETVLDPMCGAGTLLLRALQVGQPAIGIEIDEAACELVAGRLEADQRDDCAA